MQLLILRAGTEALQLRVTLVSRIETPQTALNRHGRHRTEPPVSLSRGLHRDTRGGFTGPAQSLVKHAGEAPELRGRKQRFVPNPRQIFPIEEHAPKSRDISRLCPLPWNGLAKNARPLTRQMQRTHRVSGTAPGPTNSPENDPTTPKKPQGPHDTLTDAAGAQRIRRR